MNNFDDLFTKKELPTWQPSFKWSHLFHQKCLLEQMRSHTKEYVAPKDYPTKPMHGLNWKNFFVVIERDAGIAAIIDGDTKKVITHIDTGYAVHVIKGTEHHKVDHAKDVGRFWYTIGRDGKVTKITIYRSNNL
eukprot:TRINITY_DN8255_c0_g1_i1.p1 TRINITY_DN8255_c0_g1~~TRINITY_DN8255_c0_g1_i1.p1  ORF type:complete len:134 (-),score=18.54 TRINITY_DN8255_c0_g1_i1:631-1032(-)